MQLLQCIKQDRFVGLDAWSFNAPFRGINGRVENRHPLKSLCKEHLLTTAAIRVTEKVNQGGLTRSQEETMT
jgi:hypothetical protein